MASIQKFVVNAPRPLPPRYRLLDVANIIEDPDPHWQTGVNVWGYPPTGDWVPDTTSPGYIGGPPEMPGSWALCVSSATTTATKTVGTRIPDPTFDAFTLYFTETCTMMSLTTGQQAGETQ